MTTSRPEARIQLEDALTRGFDINFSIPKKPSDVPPRNSAVLILFGELDDVPADAQISAVSDGLDVLLTRRSANMRHHPGQIAFPGGGAEAGDRDEAATALREANEETGLDPAGVDVLGSLPAIYMEVSNNLVTPVIGWWRETSAVRADGTESNEVMRVPVADLLTPEARGVSVLRHKSMTFRGAAFELPARFGGDLVWGFTGMLLSSVLDGVGWTVPWSREREFPLQPR
ncbi:NUDIX hydrolase [Gulosibacter molinativorax]|uniref:CoA pyrophosphatase n=1 Tax=Gulosibacter molinativorax TaxID=256821 RepID=A0ABT7CAE9_9MICO|nr:CoA pyrophosphatase [Gulosibacter molinativorax]MDJ1371626.1 CoA pyrophosphatase [Gulosibacter molinativorax]QUY61031.1 Putative Nudix hydrolase NudL [Gulosibacter molinativorax]